MNVYTGRFIFSPHSPVVEYDEILPGSIYPVVHKVYPAKFAASIQEPIQDGNLVRFTVIYENGSAQAYVLGRIGRTSDSILDKINAIEAKVDSLLKETTSPDWHGIYETFIRTQNPVFDNRFMHAYDFVNWLDKNYKPPTLKS